MKTVKVPLGKAVYRNIDDDEVTDSSNRIVDGFIDEVGAVRKRPGMRFAYDHSEGIGNEGQGEVWGLFSDNTYDRVLFYVVFPDRANLAALIGGSGGGTYTKEYNSTVRPQSKVRATFTTSSKQDYIFIATSNTDISYMLTTYSGAFSLVTDADVPDYPTHVGGLDGYLLCNNPGTDQFHFSLSTDPTNWVGGDFGSAIGRGDILVALHVFKREVFLFGSESLEIWENDLITPFSRLPNGYHDVGCIAPYSIVNTDNDIYWLGHKRRFIVYSGGNPEIVTTSFDADIQKYSVVDDCVADRIVIAGQEFLVFSFPTEGKTLVYNTTTDGWTEWGFWNVNTASYERWLGNCYTFDASNGRHLIGSRRGDRMLELLEDRYTDQEEAGTTGNAIRVSQRTGWIDFGTSKKKKSKELRLFLKRGGAVGNAGGVLQLRWRDDGNRQWSNWVEVGLGVTGDHLHVVKVFPRGTYRERQYEIVSSSNVPLLWMDAEEDIEVLDR